MYFDKETNLCYNRHRYYSPETGSYLSQDPIRLAGNNPTLYAYVHDPNTWLDPLGLTETATEPVRIYEAAPYHGRTDNSVKSKAPINGQEALTNSVQVKPTNVRRVGVDPVNKEIVVLDRTLVRADGTEVYHGHVRSWEALHIDQQKALISEGLTDKKGKIKCKS